MDDTLRDKGEDDFVEGTVVAQKYRLVSRIGQGAFGAVWRANHVGVGREVAIKFLHSTDVDQKLRFDREAKALARLNHPNCVTLYDFGHLDDGRSFLVTELIDGRTLDAWLGTGRSLPEVRMVVDQLVAVLAAAHEQKIVHRDLKPANVMVSQVYGEPRVKVLDFGIARIVGDETGRLTKTGEVYGTFGYMSPEQLQGARNAGPAADLYALGVIMYELIEGRPPFDGRSAFDIARGHMSEQVPTIERAVPDDLKAIVTRLMQKDPADRFPSARELGAALARVRPDDSPVLRVESEKLHSPTAATRVFESQERAVPQAPASAILGRQGARQGGISVRTLAILCVLAAVIAGGTLAAWFGFDSPSEQPAQAPVAQAGTSLTKAGANAPKPTQTPKEPAAAKPPAAEPESESVPAPACAMLPDMDPGYHRFRNDKGLRREWLVYLPETYDRTDPHPSVIIYHEGLHPPMEDLKVMGFDRWADEDGWVLLAPKESGTWGKIGGHDSVYQDLEQLNTLLCLDPSTRFGVGYGEGGFPAERSFCNVKGLRALATFAHRLEPWEVSSVCTSDPLVPYLFISPTRDPFAPVENKRGSAMDDVSSIVGTKLSLLRHRTIYHEAYGCDDSLTTTYSRGKNSCYTWGCKAPFLVCDLDGQRPWPGTRTIAGFDAGAANFPVSKTIWEFFRDVLSTSK